jgi:replication-associated recombination protein RarA
MNFQDFDQRFTPRELKDMVFHTQDSLDLINGCVTGSIGFPATGINGIILYGTYGTGKSALAKILPDLIEKSRGGLDAYSRFFNISQGGDNGAKVIENIRNQAILNTWNTAFHYFVLDEVDNLRKETMESLKVAMNTNANNCIYIMTTNKLSAIEGGVLNRSIAVEFNAAPSSSWLPRMKDVLAAYDVLDVSDEELLNIINLCDGSARKILLSARRLIEKHSKKGVNNEIY